MQSNHTALIAAAAVNSVDAMRELITHPAIDTNARDKVPITSPQLLSNIV